MARPIAGQPEAYRALAELLHPGGLRCPNGHTLPEGQAPCCAPDRDRPAFRCATCGRAFDLLSGTIWEPTGYSCATILAILQGVTRGVATERLAAELGISPLPLERRRPWIAEQIVARLPFSTVIAWAET